MHTAWRNAIAGRRPVEGCLNACNLRLLRAGSEICANTALLAELKVPLDKQDKLGGVQAEIVRAVAGHTVAMLLGFDHDDQLRKPGSSAPPAPPRK